MNQSKIELNQFNFFVACANQRSFRMAADGLGVKQSSISRHIRDLEDVIGASLFIRHSGGVSLTLAGQRFLGRVKKALDQIEEGVVEVGAIGRSEIGQIRIGLFSSIASGFISRLVSEFDKKYHNIEITFFENSAKYHLLSISNSQIDLAFTIGNRTPHPHDSQALWRERVFAAIWETHPLSAKSVLSWSDLAQESFLVRPGGPGDEVRDYLSFRLNEIGIKPRFMIHKVERYRLLSLVALRRGVAPMLASETEISIPGVVYRPILGEI